MNCLASAQHERGNIGTLFELGIGDMLLHDLEQRATFALNAESPLVNRVADSQNAGGQSNLFQSNSKKSSLTVEYARHRCTRCYGPHPLSRRVFPPQRNLHQGVNEPDQGD
jgi:hypothetical protein